MARAILADRDGTLIVEKNYLSDPEQVELIPGVGEAIRTLREDGWLVICVSNQSGVGRGYFSLEAVDAVNSKVQALLREYRAHLDAFYVCPDAPDVDSTHRKPAPGMAHDAAIAFELNLAECVVIGDKPADIGLARAIGARAVLVRTGYGAKHENQVEPDVVIDSFADLPAIIQTLQ